MAIFEVVDVSAHEVEPRATSADRWRPSRAELGVNLIPFVGYEISKKLKQKREQEIDRRMLVRFVTRLRVRAKNQQDVDLLLRQEHFNIRCFLVDNLGLGYARVTYYPDISGASVFYTNENGYSAVLWKEHDFEEEMMSVDRGYGKDLVGNLAGSRWAVESTDELVVTLIKRSEMAMPFVDYYRIYLESKNSIYAVI